MVFSFSSSSYPLLTYKVSGWNGTKGKENKGGGVAGYKESAKETFHTKNEEKKRKEDDNDDDLSGKIGSPR